jgi:hypothetical protein
MNGGDEMRIEVSYVPQKKTTKNDMTFFTKYCVCFITGIDCIIFIGKNTKDFLRWCI